MEEMTIEEQLAQLQYALHRAFRVLNMNHQWHQDYDEYEGYPESELCEQNEAALMVCKATLKEVLK